MMILVCLSYRDSLTIIIENDIKSKDLDALFLCPFKLEGDRHRKSNMNKDEE